MKISTSLTKFKFFAACLFWLGIWQAASMLVSQEILLVSPVKACATLISLMDERSFYVAVGGSLYRIAMGFIAAFIFGALAALAARFFSPARVLMAPLMAAIKATPVASFVILALIWISSKNLSIFMSFLIVLPVIYQNTLAGLDGADKKLIEMAQVFKIAPLKKLRAVYLPAAFPYLMTATQLSLGMCWKAGIAAEVIAQPKNSIGTALYRAKVFFSTPEMFAWTIAIILLSVLFEKAAVLLIKHIGRRAYG